MLSPYEASHHLLSAILTSAVTSTPLLCPSLFLHPLINPPSSPFSALSLYSLLSPFLTSPFPCSMILLPLSLALLTSPSLLHNRCGSNASQLKRHDEAALETASETDREIDRESERPPHTHTHKPHEEFYYRVPTCAHPHTNRHATHIPIQ